MNRYLLAGCAAVALAAGCGSAFAADAQPVTSASGAHILINGDAYFEGAYVNAESNSGKRNIDFANRVRVNIIPDFKADNGLEYGARLRIRNGGNAAGETSTANIDRAYIFVKGMFGEVDLGQIDGPDDNVGTVIPNSAGTGFGQDGDWTNFYSGTLSGVFLSDRVGISGNRDTKIYYTSPVFAGFQVAVAYTPQQNSSGYSPNLSQNNTGTNKYRDIYEVDALYNGTLGPVGIAGNVAYSGGQAADVVGSTGNKDLKSVKAGLDLTYGGFMVGGQYVNSFKSGYLKSLSGHQQSQQAFGAGVQYTTGPFIVAAAYAKGLDTNSAGLGEHINLYSLGATYTEAAGLATGIEWDHFEGKTNSGAAGDHGDVVIVNETLAF